MSKRLHPTLADCLVIAVSPALIMVLIGSLMHFLIEVSYRGQFPSRLNWVVACFILAAVLIARISIEMGSEHAMMYAGPLAIVTVIALNRFVKLPDGPMAAYSLWVNVGLIALIWWCAHKLTWDCAFIDESREESGEGVLQTMGLDRKGPATAIANTSKPEEKSSSPKPPEPPDAQRAIQKAKPRPHSGGVWVVYFSLAALPLFGLGQRLIPAENVDRRRYAFLLLCVYVASGLGLLLTTSFLGLRRYLRGRRLQMPATMAGAWVVTGCILIAAILGFAILLPRPSPEYAISEVPWKLTSEKRSASRYAVGKEGTEDSRKDAPGGEDHTPADAKKSGQAAGESKNARQEGRDQDAKGKAATSRRTPKSSDAKAPKGSGSQRESNGQETSQSGQTREGKSADSQSDAGDSKGGSQQQGKSGSSSQQKGSQDQAKGGSSGEQKGPQQQQQSRTSAGRKTDQDQRADAQRGAKSQGSAQGNPPQPQTAPSPPVTSSSLSFALGGILKWLFYLALIVAVAYGAWKSRAALAQAWRDFLEFLRTFWENLFGAKRGPMKAGPGETASEAKAAPRPFAEFADPFAAGWAERWPPDELVRYTFAALEAWAREHGCPRGPEQTPHEFADNVGDRSNRLKSHCRKMADLYSRAAYASGTLPATSTASLREFWQQLTSA